MMITRTLIISFLIAFFANASFGQVSGDKNLELIGKYTSRNPSHTNRKHYEEIVLNSDSTFKYYTRIGDFIRQSIEGRWSVKNNLLILNGDHSGMKKVVVNESYNPAIPKGWIKFSVQHFDNTSLNYEVAATNVDTTIILKNQFTSSLLPLFSADKFYIDGSLFRYPIYHVKKKETNDFDVKLTSKRLFIDEKWLIEEAGRIRPIGLDNQYAGYFLLKEVETD